MLFSWCVLIKTMHFLGGGSMKSHSYDRLGHHEISSVCKYMKAIASQYNNHLSANVSSDPIPKTIHHMTPKVGGALLGLGDLNNVEIK